MKRTIYSRYLDWDLDTVVRTVAPGDQNGSESGRYSVRGIAKMGADGKRSLYSSHTEQVFISEPFDDVSLADKYHEEATSQLRNMIDQLKL